MVNVHVLIDTREEDLQSFYNDYQGTRYQYLDIMDLAKLCTKTVEKLEEDENGNPVVIKEEVEVEPNIEFIPGHRYLVMNPGAYDYVKSHIHLGPRKEGFYDLTKMDYLLTRNGVVFKFVYVKYERESQFISKEQYDKMLPVLDKIEQRLKWVELINNVSKRTGKPYYMLAYYKLRDVDGKIAQFLDKEDSDYLIPYPEMKFKKIVRTVSEIREAFAFLNQPEVLHGLDYETSGFPFDDPEFYHMGVGISAQTGEGYYFDMDLYQRLAGVDWKGNPVERMPDEQFDPEPWKVFREEYLEHLKVKAEDDYTYNVSFEQRATYLLYNEIFFFHEGSSINKLDSLVTKNYSLKYTAMRVLHCPSWDDDFEMLGEVLSEMFEWCDPEEKHGTDEVYYTCEPSEVRRFERDEEGKITNLDTCPCEILPWRESPQWKLIRETFPGYEDQFEWFIEHRWGNAFSCIPADILGKYCCQDSFNTVNLRVIGGAKYSDVAWETFDNNLRLGALLEIHGIPLDEPIREKYEAIGSSQALWGKINLCRWWLDYELKAVDVTQTEFEGFTKLWLSNLRKREGSFELLNRQQIAYDDFHSILNIARDPLGNSQVPLIEEMFGKEIANWWEENLPLLPDNAKLLEKEYYKFLSDNIKMIEMYPEENPLYYPYLLLEWFGKKGRLNISKDDLFKYYNNLKLRAQIDFLFTQVDQETPAVEWDFLTGEGKIEKKDYKEISEWIKNSIYNFNSNKQFQLMENRSYGYYFKPILEMEDYEDGCIDQIEDKEELVEKLKTPLDEEAFMSHPIEWTHMVGEEGEEEEVTETVPRRVSFMHDCALVRYYYKIKDFLENTSVLVRMERKVKENGEVYYEESKVDIQKMGCVIEGKRTGDYFTAYQALCEYEGLLWMDKGDRIEDSDDPIPYFRDANQPGEWMEEAYWELPEISDSNGDLFLKSMKLARWRIFSNKPGRKAFEYIYLNKEGSMFDKTLYGYCCWQYYFTLFRKYEKELTTYINGQFTKYTHTVNDEDKNLICTERYYDEEKERQGKLKVFSPYKVCEKQSKRWSAPMHTVPSKSETKRCVTAPPGYLLSYFDISGAEVRTVAFKSKCKFFLECYEQHKDVYLTIAEMIDPGGDKAYYKSLRGMYKQILLGKFFGMGDDKLAQMTDQEVDEAIERSRQMFEHMQEITALIEEKSSYCVSHEGECETFLGDRMFMENKRRDQWQRLGINQVVQGFTAVALADGFFNNIYVSYKEGRVIIRPVNVVHDSSQNLFETKYLFEICKFYTEHMRRYLYYKHQVDWDFEVEVGTNYYDMCELSNADPDTLNIAGTHRAIKQLLDKLTADGLEYTVVSIKKGDEELQLTGDNRYAEGFEPDVPTTAVEMSLIGEKISAKYEYDKSSYKAVITRGGR